MVTQKSDFLKALSKEIISKVPIYCTGYPELAFMEKYISQYKLKPKSKELELYEKNYNIIKRMGFDAISLWDFRRGEGGYILDDQKRVDGWGRIYKGEWYLWDGVFKNEKILDNWEYLTLPTQEKLIILKEFLIKTRKNLDYAISLPGLFEKTWQSMGFHYFAKCLRRNIEFIKTVISYFSIYVKNLINTLQTVGAHIFLIADDYGYKNRTFIPKKLWEDLFFRNYREIIELIHEKHQRIIIHSDGYISDMIETFIELNFDGVQGLEPNAGVDIFLIFKRFKDKICFIGNLDMSLLSFDTPKEVNYYTNKLISKARKYNCYFVVSPSHQINSKCNPENINAMIQTAKIFK